MITFKQYIAEARWDPEGSLEDYLADHCQSYMTALDASLDAIIHDMCLYRGVNIGGGDDHVRLLIDGQPRTCYIKNVRKDRKPLDTHPELSSILDEIFQEKFGWKARSTGLFCKAHWKGLNEFGDVHKIYPLGLFSFLYSPAVPDLTGSIQHVLAAYEFPKKWSGQEHTPEELDKAKEILTKFVERKEYTDHDLPAAFIGPKLPEIMLDCDKYLVVPV
ncbi:hypothetical protein [Acinetobacter sp.]|uniref:hypothetical protein n=1 Tax=Acinetobacter sp. TaxID=472 RepID=UPI00388EB0CA